MEQEQLLSVAEMRALLESLAGSRLPVRITERGGLAVLRYVRGFADQQKNVLLVSESANSLGMSILEIKDIRTLEYSAGNAEWKVIHAR